jgi:hypothetical protein
MTRIGTGLGSKARSYGVSLTTTFRQLESARTDDSIVPSPGFNVDLAVNKVRTLDSAYTQGILIQNTSTTATVYVAGIEYAGLVGTTIPGGGVAYNQTAFPIPPGKTVRIDCRDGTGLCLAASASIAIDIFGN